MCFRSSRLVAAALLFAASTATAAEAPSWHAARRTWRVADAKSHEPADLGHAYGFRDLARGIAADQSGFWAHPGRAGMPRLAISLPIAAGFAGLLAADGEVTEGVNRSLDKSDIDLSGDVSDTADMAFSYGLPVALWAIGRMTHRPRLAETGGLMTQALFSTGVETEALKLLTGRARPGEIEGREFTGPSGGLLGGLPSRADSFPSGHTSAAFAVATVLAARTHHRWVKWAAFGTAGIIAAGRISGDKHYASDVLAGATLGWAQGRLTLRTHRNAVDAARAADLLRQASGH